MINLGRKDFISLGILPRFNAMYIYNIGFYEKH